jgi:geranylgeranylglycerol-phosphate geranylgeranyltransferase
MDQIKGLYKICRPITTLTGALAVVMGGYVAGTGEWFNIALAVVATILVSSSANAWNDYLDIEIDRVNQPHRPLPSGQVSLRAAKWFSFILAGLSILVASFINLPSLMIVVGANILLYIYSYKLKSTVLLGNLVIAFISAMSAVAGGVAAGNARPTFWLFLVIFVAILGREVLKTMADYEGDLKESVRTISTVWGKRTARTVFYILIVATLITMLLPYLLEIYQPIYAYLILFGVFPVIGYIAYRVGRAGSGRQLEKMSQLMKYDFLFWFLAVILGSSV